VEISDPGADLAVALALSAAVKDRPLGAGCAVFGEVGLGGEVRRVSRLEARLREAAALGVRTAIVPSGFTGEPPPGIVLRRVRTVAEALSVA
jgi:DNA repair protein RadA/Sms